MLLCYPLVNQACLPAPGKAEFQEHASKSAIASCEGTAELGEHEVIWLSIVLWTTMFLISKGHKTAVFNCH